LSKSFFTRKKIGNVRRIPRGEPGGKNMGGKKRRRSEGGALLEDTDNVSKIREVKKLIFSDDRGRGISLGKKEQ